jgi:predicted amidohydrolase YtcJ
VAYPETILFNGKILTVDDSFSIAEALAVRGDKILAVGANPEILPLAGPATTRVDLRGRTVVPGFIDTHAHWGGYSIAHMSLEEKGIQWEGRIEWLGLLWDSPAMALRDVRRAVQASAPGELIRISVMLRDPILPQMKMKELDEVSPQNPVVFVNMTQMAPRAANTRALEMAKIGPDTPGLPKNGGIELGGTANGMLSDYLTWAIPPEKLIPWHKKGMLLANRWGLTLVETRIEPDEFNAIRELWLGGDLSLRWRVAFPGPIDVPHTGNISDIGDDWLRITGRGGGMSIPGYTATREHWTTRSNPPNLEEEAAIRTRWLRLREDFLEAWRYGWSIPNTHVLGDIAVKEILNVVEEAQKNPIARSRNQRFTLDHMVEVDERDIARMKALGVYPSNLMKDIFTETPLIGSSAYEAAFGVEYVNKMLPLKRYIDAGIRPSLESDTGEEMEGEPLWMIEKAVCRCVDGAQRVWGRDQKVSREDALRMKTIWSAEQTGDKARLGSLEPGKLADLVVLDGDYLTVPEDRISDLKVALTMVGGRIVYSTTP